MRTLALAALATLAGCSPCEPSDYYVGPVCVDNHVLTPAERDSVRAAIAPALILGIAWWVATPDELRGVRIVFSDSHITSEEGSTITLFRRADTIGEAPGCGEWLVRGLPHEIGHIALGSRYPWDGDPLHEDRRWDREDSILARLYASDPNCATLPR